MEFVDGETTRRQAQAARHPSVSGGVAEAPKPPAGSPDIDLSRAILESAPVSLIVVSPSGHIIGGNSASVALFGAERLDGHVLASFVEAEDRVRAVEFIAQVCSGQPGTLRYWLVDARGRRRAVETRGVPVRQHDGSTLVLGATWEATSPQRGILAAVAEAARGALGTVHHALTGRRAPQIPTGDPGVAAIEHERLKRRVADLEDGATDYTAQRTQLDARLAELARAADAHATERNQLRAQIADLRAAVDAQPSERKQVEGRVAELAATVSAAATERERLERRIADLEDIATDHAVQRTQLGASLAEVARAADEHARERNDLRTRLAALQLTIDDRRKEWERLAARITELEAVPPADRDPARSYQPVATSDEMQSLERQIADLRKELERYGLDLEAQVVRADRVEADLAAIRPSWMKPNPSRSDSSSSWLNPPSEGGQPHRWDNGSESPSLASWQQPLRSQRGKTGPV
jgi:PAS domain S-box-containing protein